MATPVVTVASGGIPVTDVSGTSRGLPVTEATRGTAVTKVAAGGLPVNYVSATGVSGPTVVLSNNTVPSAATIGTTIGSLSTVNTTGTYTYALTSNPGSLFAISGPNLNVAAALSAGVDPIVVQASGGVPTPISQGFAIVATPPFPDNNTGASEFLTLF